MKPQYVSSKRIGNDRNCQRCKKVVTRSKIIVVSLYVNYSHRLKREMFHRKVAHIAANGPKSRRKNFSASHIGRLLH
jgi:hypothetical protein